MSTDDLNKTKDSLVNDPSSGIREPPARAGASAIEEEQFVYFAAAANHHHTWQGQLQSARQALLRFLKSIHLALRYWIKPWRPYKI